MPSGTRIADYLDAIAYRRYARSVMEERRRLLGWNVRLLKGSLRRSCDSGSYHLP